MVSYDGSTMVWDISTSTFKLQNLSNTYLTDLLFCLGLKKDWKKIIVTASLKILLTFLWWSLESTVANCVVIALQINKCISPSKRKKLKVMTHTLGSVNVDFILIGEPFKFLWKMSIRSKNFRQWQMKSNLEVGRRGEYIIILITLYNCFQKWPKEPNCC